MKILISNPGSTSVKYAAYENSKKTLVKGFSPDKIAIRIVAPGSYFQENHVIDDKFIKKLKAVMELAPLHIGSCLLEINKLKKKFPKAKILGISDSKFHKTQQSQYALPKSILAKFDIKRFGYHGLSMASIVGKTKSKNVIICHLGGGTSMAYIKFGKSLETSMGYTPLEGLIGSTRSGNIDPGIFLCLNKKYSVKQIESILNNQSGLKALSGKTDMKEILKSNNKKALDFYISQIKSYIGAYIAKYPEINEIIFTGAIGAGSWKIRQMICNNLQHLGISLDNQKNQKIKEGMEGSFSKGKLKLSVIKTDEESEILKQIK